MGRETRKTNPGKPAGAFTLVEMLTIIVILSMLITLATPSFLEARKAFLITESETILGQLEKGIGMYKQTWYKLPPVPDKVWSSKFNGYEHLKGLPPSGSDSDDSVSGGLEGRHALVQALTGYLGESDDGEDGKGSRYEQRGSVHGPFVSPEMKTKGDPPSFVDAFDNEILYYRFEPGGGRHGGGFESSNNSGVGPSSLGDYLQDPNGDLYRRDFVLLSPGPDRRWMDLSEANEEKETDDIANFMFRFEQDD